MKKFFYLLVLALRTPSLIIPFSAIPLQIGITSFLTANEFALNYTMITMSFIVFLIQLRCRIYFISGFQKHVYPDIPWRKKDRQALKPIADKALADLAAKVDSSESSIERMLNERHKDATTIEIQLTNLAKERSSLRKHSWTLTRVENGAVILGLNKD